MSDQIDQIDLDMFGSIVAQADDLKSANGGKMDTLSASEDLYFMDWDDEDRVQQLNKDIKITKSPDGRNMLLGARRLLTTTEPVFSVPKERGDDAAAKASEPLEMFSEQMYRAICGVRGKKVHDQAAHSGLLHDEIHIAVISTADLLKYAEQHEGTKGKAYVARAKQVNMRTPYLWKVFNAKGCYWDEDDLGMNAHYRETNSTARRIRGDWGYAAVPDDDGVKGTDVYKLCEWWDLEYHAVWLDEKRGEPILCEEHGLPFIPIYSTLVEGDKELESDAGRQNQPFLYTLDKSGMADRQNMALTVWMTNLFAMGANTSYLFKTATPNQELVVDTSVIGGATVIGTQDSLAPMPRELVPPELFGALEMMDNKVSESTMFRQALGGSLGGSSSFSEVALLSQSGRLPLTKTKDKLGQALAGAMRISLLWIKEEGEGKQAKYGSKVTEINASDIPEDVEIECNIEVSLPQDKLQNSNIYGALTGGDDPGVSKRWGRENILGVGQSEEMDREIWTERASGRMYQMFVEEVLPGLMKGMAGQEQGPGMPPGMPMQQGMPMPPGMGAGMGPEPGMPMGGPQMGQVPSVMAQGPAMPGELPGEQRIGLDDGGLPPDDLADGAGMLV